VAFAAPDSGPSLACGGHRAATVQFQFLEGWFDMRDLSMVLDHDRRSITSSNMAASSRFL
jgi:hypothetical protein